MQQLEFIISYGRERVLTATWLGLSIALGFLGHGDAPFNPWIILLSVIFMAAFRLLDDSFCMEFERQARDARKYFQYSPKLFYLPILSVFGGIASFLWIYGSKELFQFGLVTVLVSVMVYRLSRVNVFIKFVSLLKYPFVLYTIGFFSGGDSWVWILLGSFLMLVREVFEEGFHKRSIAAEAIVAAILIFGKIWELRL